jgi:hypothetical protein
MDCTSFIPERNIKTEKVDIIKQDIINNPEKTRKYLLKLLDKINCKHVSYVAFNIVKNEITIYIREHKVRNGTYLRGFRSFNVDKLAEYLSSTRYKP